MMLGKTPARHDAIKLKLRHYISPSVLPTPPAEFGHDGLVLGQNWAVLGNDKWGDCVWAGAAHETILWNLESSKAVTFSDTTVLSDYAAVTGFAYTDDTDQGTDMQSAASYRLKTGIVDVQGNRHKIGAYLEIQKGNIEEHLIAAYVFGAIGIGITFPQSAMDQFDAGQIWSISKGSPIIGGHYIPSIARRNNRFVVVTWGKEIEMDDDFFVAYNDESVVYLSSEMMIGDKTIDGFDMDQLKTDFDALQH